MIKRRWARIYGPKMANGTRDSSITLHCIKENMTSLCGCKVKPSPFVPDYPIYCGTCAKADQELRDSESLEIASQVVEIGNLLYVWDDLKKCMKPGLVIDIIGAEQGPYWCRRIFNNFIIVRMDNGVERKIPFAQLGITAFTAPEAAEALQWVRHKSRK